jgi:repressor LexA
MFATSLKQLRKKLGITQAELAAKMGITQQAVGRWETGAASPDAATLVELAKMFRTSVDVLLGYENNRAASNSPPESGMVMVPIIGTVKAGYGALAFEEDYGAEYANVRNEDNYFYLLVKGDSMEPRIRDGDLALVHKQPTLDDGDLGVIVFNDGEGTLKLFRRRGNSIILQAFNNAYKPIVISGDNLNSVYIAGKVVETKSQW